MPLVNVVILRKLCKYHHNSYITENQILWTTLLLQTVGV